MVPRTVAELYLPLVWNLPFPLPQSLPRTDFGPFFFFFFADTSAARARFSGAHSEREIVSFITRFVSAPPASWASSWAPPA